MMMPPERAGNWGHEETDLLLRLWGRPDIQKEMLTTLRNLDIYNSISDEMRRHMPNCRRTGLQCRYRIKRLKRDFIRAKNEVDKRSQFVFYDQMDAGLTERSKAAETARLARDGKGGKKRKRSKKKKKEKSEGNAGAVASSQWPAMTHASEIKIEIDNAEEYEYGVSKQAGAERHDDDKESSDDDDDDDDDDDGEDDDDRHHDLPSTAAGSRDARAEQEEKTSSLPIRFYDPVSNRMVELRDICSGDPSDRQSTSLDAADTDQTSKALPTPPADMSNAGEHKTSSPDSSSSSASPFPFFIKSVYHVKDVDPDDASDKDDSDVTTGPSDKEPSNASYIPDDELDKREDEDSSPTLKPNILRHRSADDRAGTKTTDVPSTDAAPNTQKKTDSASKSVIGGLPKLASQVDKDLQIIAEWNVKREPEFDEDSTGTPAETASGLSEMTEIAGTEESSSGLVSSSPAITSALDESTKEKGRSPQVSPSSSSLVLSSSLTSSMPSPPSVKVKTGVRYKIIESKGVRTLLRIPEHDPGLLQSRMSATSTTTASGSVRTVSSSSTAAVRFLSSSSVSTGATTVTRSGLSLLSSAQRVVRAPRVVLYEGPGRRLYASSSSSSTPTITIPTSAAGRLASTSDLGRKVVVAATSSTTVTPVRVFHASSGTSLLGVSQEARKMFHLKPPSSTATTTISTASSARPVPLGAPQGSKPFTFTTLSSLDPTPKRVTLSPEPSSHPSAASPSSSSKTTIIIPRNVLPATSQGSTTVAQVVSPRETTQKELKRKLESNLEREWRKRAAKVAAERKMSILAKQSNEESSEDCEEPSEKVEEVKTKRAGPSVDIKLAPGFRIVTDSESRDKPPVKVIRVTPPETSAAPSLVSTSRVVKHGPTNPHSRPILAKPTQSVSVTLEDIYPRLPLPNTSQTVTARESRDRAAEESPQDVIMTTKEGDGLDRRVQQGTRDSLEAAVKACQGDRITAENTTTDSAAIDADKETEVAMETESGMEAGRHRITANYHTNLSRAARATNRHVTASDSHPEIHRFPETSSARATSSPSPSRVTTLSLRGVGSDEALFKHFLSTTELSSECTEWMMQTLRSRTTAAASTASSSEAGSLGRGRDEPHRGSDVEVTNLVVNDGSVRADKQTGTFKVKAGMAQMTKGGIIMDVTTPEEARVAEEAGACAVMALERVPADIRRQGGVARMTDPKIIKDIMAVVTIPVMAKCRIGHFAEAQILESLGVDMVDESEVLTPADEEHHVDKQKFKVPFVCGARDLGEALRRISEGAAMIRTKGEAGTGDVVEAVRHARTINRQIRTAQALDHTELYNYAKELMVSYDLLKKTADLGRLPVVNFAAGGLATPADVSLLLQLGVDGVFVGSGIFKSSDPPSRARAMAQAVTHYKDPTILATLSENLGEAMFGTPVNQQMRTAASASGNKEQEKLWNATLAMEKFKVTA